MEFKETEKFDFKLEIYKPPKLFGWWVIGGNEFYFSPCKIASYKKVSKFHIKMMKLLLDIDWIEESND
jgi:hypothetical protein